MDLSDFGFLGSFGWRLKIFDGQLFETRHPRPPEALTSFLNDPGDVALTNSCFLRLIKVTEKHLFWLKTNEIPFFQKTWNLTIKVAQRNSAKIQRGKMFKRTNLRYANCVSLRRVITCCALFYEKFRNFDSFWSIKGSNPSKWTFKRNSGPNPTKVLFKSRIFC